MKQYITNIWPTCRLIVSRPTMRTHNGMAALTLSNLNKHLGQLEVDFIDNVNVMEVQLRKKGLHLYKNCKNRLELIFLQKLRNLWWSLEHLKETHDKSHKLDRSFREELNNRDRSLNLISSSDCSDRQFNGLSHSTLHELRKNDPFKVIISHININSVRIS